MTCRTVAAVWVGLHVVFLVGWAASEELRLVKGQSILVRTVPVDPRDLLRGQYIRLAYEFSTANRFAHPTAMPPHGSPIWAVLREDGKYHVPYKLYLRQSSRAEADTVVLRGHVNHSRLLFGIEEYFVPEGTETPNPRDITVRLRVGRSGQPRIKQVYVREQPWP